MLLNTKEAAQRCRLSTSTLEKYRVTGDGPRFAKLGERVIYRAEDIDAWIAARLVSSTSEKVAA